MWRREAKTGNQPIMEATIRQIKDFFVKSLHKMETPPQPKLETNPLDFRSDVAAVSWEHFDFALTLSFVSKF